MKYFDHNLFTQLRYLFIFILLVHFAKCINFCYQLMVQYL